MKRFAFFFLFFLRAPSFERPTPFVIFQSEKPFFSGWVQAHSPFCLLLFSFLMHRIGSNPLDATL